MSYRGLLLDVMGTLVIPRRSVSGVYAELGQRFEVTTSQDEIRHRMHDAFYGRYPLGGLRFEGDGELFWRYVLLHATGSSNDEYFNAVSQHFSCASNWRVLDGAVEMLQAVRDGGVKVGLVENYDTRLRSLLRDLELLDHVDSLTVSAEVGVEKPSEKIFEAAIQGLFGDDFQPDSTRDKAVLHVGDDEINDCWAAEQAGCEAKLWGADVHDFRTLQEHVLGTPSGSFWRS